MPVQYNFSRVTSSRSAIVCASDIAAEPVRYCERRPARPLQGHVHPAKIAEIYWGKCPTPTVAVNPRNYPVLNGLRHYSKRLSVGKSTVFFPQFQAEIPRPLLNGATVEQGCYVPTKIAKHSIRRRAERKISQLTIQRQLIRDYLRIGLGGFPRTRTFTFVFIACRLSFSHLLPLQNGTWHGHARMARFVPF